MGAQIITPPAYQRPSGRLWLNNNQEDIQDQTDVLVLLDTITTNFNDGIENITTHRITPGKPGYYLISASIYYANCIVDKCYETIVKLNSGVFILDGFGHLSDSTKNVITVKCADIRYLGATDYVDLYARVYTGVNTVDIWADINRTFLTVQRVR